MTIISRSAGKGQDQVRSKYDNTKPIDVLRERESQGKILLCKSCLDDSRGRGDIYVVSVYVIMWVDYLGVMVD